MSESVTPAATVFPPPPGVVPQGRGGREAPGWLMHSGMTAGRFIGMYAMAAIFPMTAGVIFFGWRALGALGVVLVSAALAVFAWRRVGSRGDQLRYSHCLWLSGLLALTLPAHLFSLGTSEQGMYLWPVLAAGGVIIVIVTWLFGGVGAGRVHPLLVTHLLLFICFKELLVPHYVLNRRHVVFGDIYRAAPAGQTATLPWIQSRDQSLFDATRWEPASKTLLEYTSGALSSDRSWISLDAVLRDRMPPLEDLIIGGHPAPLGLGSCVAIIVGGLFLLYRGLIDYRVPLFIILGAAAAMAVLPVPIVIKDTGDVIQRGDVVWRWFVMFARDVPGTQWQVGATLINYNLLAGPLVFMAFFLATSPEIRPIARRARLGFALIAGILSGVCQLYVSVAAGPYIALLVAGALTPTFDRLFRPRTLV